MTLPTAQPTGASAAASGPPIVVAFATQKGGMGKTTLSVLVASWLHYKRRIPVAILDVDSSQLSVVNLRLREIEHMDEETRQRFNEQGIDHYEVLRGDPADVPKLLKQLPADVRIVFIDLPGNIDVEGYETALSSVDYLLVPMETSEFSVTTGFSYLSAIRQVELLPADRCRIVWNKYKESRDGALADQLEERFLQYGFTSLKSRIPQRDSYQESGNRSTMFPMPSTYLRNSGLKDLFIEIESLLPILTPKSDGQSK
jgi:chromosome partitioning protein